MLLQSKDYYGYTNSRLNLKKGGKMMMEVIQLSKKEYRVAQLKAAMYSGGNVNKFISKAILGFGKDDNASTDTIDLYIEKDGEMQPVTVKNVPLVAIDRLGETTPHENMILSATLEEIIKEDFAVVPTEIDFAELIK